MVLISVGCQVESARKPRLRILYHMSIRGSEGSLGHTSSAGSPDGQPGHVTSLGKVGTAATDHVCFPVVVFKSFTSAHLYVLGLHQHLSQSQPKPICTETSAIRSQWVCAALSITSITVSLPSRWENIPSSILCSEICPELLFILPTIYPPS